jgi:hypothetical protein
MLGAIDRPIGYKHYKGAICPACLEWLLGQDEEKTRAEKARKQASEFHPSDGFWIHR